MMDSDKITNNNDSSIEDVEKIVKKLFSLKNHYSDEVTKIFKSRNANDIAAVTEFMKMFDYTNLSVLDAFRLFNKKIYITGDYQSMEYIIKHFCTRYCECNQESFNKIETLSLSIMMLNTDFYKNNSRVKIDLKTFSDQLAKYPAEYNFNKEFIAELYKSIKNNELKSSLINDRPNKRSPSSASDSNNVKRLKNEYIDKIHFAKGLVSRKVESESGKSNNIFKKNLSRKKYFASLEDLSLSLFKKEDAIAFFSKCNIDISIGSSSESDSSNLQKFLSQYRPLEVMALHHCYAAAIPYNTSKFILNLANGSKYSFKVATPFDIEFWCSNINQAAALLSKPNQIFLNTVKFSSGKVYFSNGLTNLNHDEQMAANLTQLEKLKTQLEFVENDPLECSEKKKTIDYIKLQIERFKTYITVLKFRKFPEVRITCGDYAGHASYEDTDVVDNDIDSLSTYSSNVCSSDCSSKISLINKCCEITKFPINETSNLLSKSGVNSLYNKTEIGRELRDLSETEIMDHKL